MKLIARFSFCFSYFDTAYYPVTDQLVAEFKNELASYEVSKGTVRFPLSEPVPVKLIGRIAKFRAKEGAAREKG